jgi:NAD(P)-dependent dehydrogenase (short-subunit alcohol dehydrogenase family)
MAETTHAEQMDNTNKAVLITGGTRGLGAALAIAWKERGARVGIVGQHVGRLAEVARRHGLSAIRADVGDKDAIHRIVGQAQALLGPIDVLIHNASALGATPLRGLLDTECEDLQRVLDVNLLGPFRLSKALAGGMLLRGGGALVHVSSDAGIDNYPRWGAYGVSKAALDHLSRQWAVELPRLRVLSIDPGEMDTDMHRDAVPDADPRTLLSPDAVAQRIVRIIEDDKYASGSRVRAMEQQP